MKNFIVLHFSGMMNNLFEIMGFLKSLVFNRKLQNICDKWEEPTEILTKT